MMVIVRLKLSECIYISNCLTIAFIANSFMMLGVLGQCRIVMSASWFDR